MATEKQVNFVMALLSRAGYDTRYMDAKFKALGAKMRERSGTVEAWIRSRNQAELDVLIAQLKQEGGEK